MKVVLRKSEWLDDWYIIERAQHEHRQHLEQVGSNAFALMCSSRISDADVEGCASEMLAIADAIEERGYSSSKRCAVDARTDRVQLWSPRNSQHPGVITYAEADELAADIRRVLETTQAKSTEDT